MNGSFVFSVADEKNINVIEKELNVLPTKIIHKGEKISIHRIAKKNRWIYSYDFKDNINNNICEFLDLFLKNNSKILKKIKASYEEVNLTIQIRSDYGQIGLIINQNILKRISKLNIDLEIDILSFGMVEK